MKTRFDFSTRKQYKRRSSTVLLVSDDIMPKRNAAPQLVHRRAPAWNDDLTALAEQAAQLVKSQKIYFPYSLTWGKKLNVNGIIQGVLNAMAAQTASVTPEQWKRYLNTFSKMVFIAGKTKGIHFDQPSLDSFRAIGKAIETQPHDGIRVKWNLEYHYPLVIAVALLWFIDHHRKS